MMPMLAIIALLAENQWRKESVCDAVAHELDRSGGCCSDLIDERTKLSANEWEQWKLETRATTQRWLGSKRGWVQTTMAEQLVELELPVRFWSTVHRSWLQLSATQHRMPVSDDACGEQRAFGCESRWRLTILFLVRLLLLQLLCVILFQS